MTAQQAYGVGKDERDFVVTSIRSLLPDARIIAFGSRISGGAKKYSDLDVAIDTKDPNVLTRLAQLNERFAESNLLYKIDLSLWSAMDEEFRKRVGEAGETW